MYCWIFIKDNVVIYSDLLDCGDICMYPFVQNQCITFFNAFVFRHLEFFFSCHVVVVAEVTQPSLGVGYEIGRAVAMKKKILCLFRPNTDKRKLFNKNYDMSLNKSKWIPTLTYGIIFRKYSDW